MARTYTLTAATVLGNARELLGDNNPDMAPRNSDSRLLAALNEALMAMVTTAPGLFSTHADMACAAGYLQEVQFARAAMFIDVIGLPESDPATLGLYRPRWMQDQADVPENFMRIPGDPLRFMVYPPAVVDSPLTVRFAKVAMQIGAGDLSGVNDFYAKYVPDGAHLDELKVDPKTGIITANRSTLDGRKLSPQTFKNRDELLAGLSALKDPMSLYNFSQNEFSRQLQERQVKVAERRESSLDQDRQTARDQQSAREDAAVALFKEQNPTATAAQLDAVRTGVIPATPAEKDSPAEVKLANAILKSGMAGDMKEALQIAISKKGKSADEMHSEFVSAQLKNYATPEDAVKKADDVMTKMGYKKKGNRWDAGADTAVPGKPASEDEALTQAKQALAGGASKDAVNQRLKSWGYKPLP